MELEAVGQSAYGKSINRHARKGGGGSISEEELGHAYLGGRISWRRLIRRLVAAGASLCAAATCAGVLSPDVALARDRVTGHVEYSTNLEFVNFRYLGASSKQHGLLMELKTQSGTASDTSVRLHSGTSNRVLVNHDIGAISHDWHRFVLRVNGKAPRPGQYDLEVFQGSTYSATFYFTVH